MIYTLPWVTPGTPVNPVSVTVINSANWDKRESSTEYMNSYVKDCIYCTLGLQSEPDYTRDNCSLLCMMLVNTSQVQLK